MNRITYNMLKEAKACRPALRTFQRPFPNGAPVSMRSARRALEAGLDVDFLTRFLSPEAQKAHSKAKSQALKAYHKATDQALKIYDEARAKALNAYYYYQPANLAQAWNTFNKATAQARETFNKAMDQANKSYNEATAQALVNALLATRRTK